ncbi:unnamed protein product, partial [Ixodes pacificus]
KNTKKTGLIWPFYTVPKRCTACIFGGLQRERRKLAEVLLNFPCLYFLLSLVRSPANRWPICYARAMYFFLRVQTTLYFSA